MDPVLHLWLIVLTNLHNPSRVRIPDAAPEATEAAP